jgi:hypothetical protein
MSERNTAWCRTLGNYASGPQPLRGAAPRSALSQPLQRTPSMAFKPPRAPNPNVALLQRQRALATPHIRASAPAPGRIQALFAGERVVSIVRRALRADTGETHTTAGAAD